MSLDIITRGVIEFYAFAMFLGIALAVLLIIFGIMFRPRRGGAYRLGRRVNR